MMKFVCTVITAGLLWSTPTIAGDGMTVKFNGKLYSKSVETHPSQGEVREIKGSKATLLTTSLGVVATVETVGLTPGHAYTLWFVAINNPEACENKPCKSSDVLGNSAAVKSDVGFGDGLVAGPSGRAVFTAHRVKGSIPQAWIGTGLTEPETAEIHLVVHDHGPLISGREAEMTGTFRGACLEESLSEMAPATARADGQPGPNSCALIQDVIFVQ